MFVSAVSSQAVCNATFGRTLEENIAKIKSYRLSTADKYFKDLDSPTPHHNKTLKQPGSTTDELPVIATAASSYHYFESVEMLTSLATVIRPTYPTIPVYYYDLGLEPDQKKEVNFELSSRYGLKFALVLEPRRLAPSFPSQNREIYYTCLYLKRNFTFLILTPGSRIHSKEFPINGNLLFKELFTLLKVTESEAIHKHCFRRFFLGTRRNNCST